MVDNPVFEIVANSLAVYDAIGGRKIGAIPKGIKFAVIGGSRQVANGAVWWQHSVGWSIEKTVDEATVFLREVVLTPATDTPAATAEAQPDTVSTPATDETPTATVDEAPPATTDDIPTPAPAQNPLMQELVEALRGLPAKANLRTTDKVNIRDAPAGKYTGSLAFGSVVQADMETLQQRDTHYWVEHNKGWSALQSVSGKSVFFEDAGEIYVPGPDGPKVEEMPGYQSLIVRHPIDLDATNQWQYFGNTSFAYLYGYKFNYRGFAQGLHSGLDYMNSATSARQPVYAGVHGRYAGTIYDPEGRKWNHQVRVQTKEGHLLIYQHINPASFQSGQEIEPDTVVGTVNRDWDTNNDHLHLEIRFNDGAWIVNPLAFMKPELADQIVEKFEPDRPGTGASGSDYYYFYVTDEWTKWGSPFEQPIIEYEGPRVDPKSKGG